MVIRKDDFPLWEVHKKKKPNVTSFIIFAFGDNVFKIFLELKKIVVVGLNPSEILAHFLLLALDISGNKFLV